MDKELQLVRMIVSGDEGAWRSFIEEYAPYIQTIIARYVNDEELAGDLLVMLLEKLKKKLSVFGGGSTLSTWLFIVTRNFCRDYYRTISGVRHVKKLLSGLSRLDARFFEYYYLRSMHIDEALQSLKPEFGKDLSYLDLIESLERIRRKAVEMKLGRLLFRLLRPEEHPALPTREEAAALPGLGRFYESVVPSPDTLLESRDLQLLLKKLNEAILGLDYEDKLLLKLRFEYRKSARKIAEMLGIGAEKRVYKRIDHLIEKLGLTLAEEGLEPDSCRNLVYNLDILYYWQENWSEREMSN